MQQHVKKPNLAAELDSVKRGMTRSHEDSSVDVSAYQRGGDSEVEASHYRKSTEGEVIDVGRSGHALGVMVEAERVASPVIERTELR